MFEEGNMEPLDDFKFEDDIQQTKNSIPHKRKTNIKQNSGDANNLLIQD